jgi:hypothetical protein
VLAPLGLGASADEAGVRLAHGELKPAVGLFSPALPPEMWSKVVIILAITAGLCRRACAVAHTLIRLVAWAMPAIMVMDSIDVAQYWVVPPKPRHLPIESTKSSPLRSAARAASRLDRHRPSSGGAASDTIQPPLATGRKTPKSLLAAPSPGMPQSQAVVSASLAASAISGLELRDSSGARGDL